MTDQMSKAAVARAIKACPAHSSAYVVSDTGMVYGLEFRTANTPRGGVFDVLYVRGHNLESLGAERWTDDLVGSVNGRVVTGLHGATCRADDLAAAMAGRKSYQSVSVVHAKNGGASSSRIAKAAQHNAAVAKRQPAKAARKVTTDAAAKVA